MSKDLSPPGSAETVGLADLLARVEAATAADRELDGEIWCAVRGYRFMNHTSRGEGFIYWHGARQFRGEAERLTASLDAALALCERVLPGWLRMLDEQDPHVWTASLFTRPGMKMHPKQFDAVHGPPPLALLTAMLRALIAGGTPMIEPKDSDPNLGNDLKASRNPPIADGQEPPSPPSMQVGKDPA